jgi:hypothetical protein
VVGAVGGKHWVPADEREILASEECAAGVPPLLYRTFRVKATLINLYRCVRASRLCSASPNFCSACLNVKARTSHKMHITHTHACVKLGAH